QHWHMVHARIVETGQQVGRARTRGGDANAQPAGEFRICRSHEGSHLFMPGLDEADLSIGPVERTEYAVDAVSGIPIDAPHAPLVKPLDDEISDCRGHLHPPLDRVSARRGCGNQAATDVMTAD